MQKLPPEIVARYPTVAVFFADVCSERHKAGVHRTHLIRSNGVYMLCCDDDGEAHIIRLNAVKLVRPQSDDRWVASLDEMTGHIVYRPHSGAGLRSTGPVKGRADPSIDLVSIASDLGLEYAALESRDGTVTSNTPTIRGLTTAQLKAGPDELSPGELLHVSADDYGGDYSLLADDEFSLSEFDGIDNDKDEGDVSAVSEVNLGQEQRGRLSDD